MEPLVRLLLGERGEGPQYPRVQLVPAHLHQLLKSNQLVSIHLGANHNLLPTRLFKYDITKAKEGLFGFTRHCLIGRPLRLKSA
jgi:hypothetical protein